MDPLISFTLSQNINCSVDVVFSFVSDLTNMPRWNYFIQRVTKISDGPIGVGTIFEQTRPRDQFLIKIEQLDAPHNIVARLQPPGPDLIVGFTLVENNGQTSIQYRWRLDVQDYSILKYIPKGKFKNWILSIVSNQIHTKTKPAVEQNFSKLKVLLETGEVILQDGRKMTLH